MSRWLALTAAPVAPRIGCVVLDATGQLRGTPVPANTLVVVELTTTSRGAEQARVSLLPPSALPPAFRVVDGPAPAGAEVVARASGVTVYRTVASLRRRAAAQLARLTGDRDVQLRVLVTLEAAILLHAETAGVVSAESDRRWAQYQRLKALALRPGTAAEGQAALGRALHHARTLAGLKEVLHV